MIDVVSETANCQMDCCRSLAEWSAYVAALDVDAVRAGYGLGHVPSSGVRVRHRVDVV